jgi:hypothetical protein
MLEDLNVHILKVKLDSCAIPHSELNLRWIICTNIKAKTSRTAQRKLMLQVGGGQRFLVRIEKSLTIKKITCFKIENFC